ncbi:MAG TPA: type VI secretion system tip protein TssI/VgrG [Gemmataceae bacterium]|nr:type VI secretion system tip protein TssI/VgrG [Gemmataceae bacterium]
MADNTQANRAIRITTPLGADALLITGLTGTEALSELFRFQLDLLRPAAKKAVPFDQILGQPVTVEMELPGSGKRHFNGVVNRFVQGKVVRLSQDPNDTFIQYRAEIVPNFWLLTKKVQSRIFQHVTVPDILKKVVTGFPVKFDIQGSFQPRDYCVQYRESDFAFASRLMEEEGIYYFFKHTAGGHEMVLANTPKGHPDVPFAKKIIYEEVTGGNRPDQRILRWDKAQELRAGKVTLFDHNFELPHKHLEADKAINGSVQSGTVTHKLAVGPVPKMELYDYPGAYAGRFDGVDKGGSDKPGDLQKIFDDNKRTAGLRMEEEAAGAVVIEGAGHWPQATAGHAFTLDKHFDANGDYVLTRVEHSGQLAANYRSGEGDAFSYQNRFECIPAAVPFRPERVTPRPTVKGAQTAVVVGPGGEEIFCDKYGRIKVQFHWDREGKNDGDSSCWVRVGTMWAGKQWGMIHIPRIGQEVIVDFLEGDPNDPIVVGSVYNADQMPPWALPGNKTQSGIQTRSSPGGGGANFNQIRFEDKKGAEQVHIHAEKNQDIEVEHDETHWVGHDRKKTIDHDETTLVKHDRTETVNNNETITIDGDRKETVHKTETIVIDGDRTETVHSNESITIDKNRTEKVGGNENITISGARTENVSKDESITISGGRTENVSKNESITIGGARTESVAKDEGITISGGRTVSVAKDEGLTVTGGQTESVGKDRAISVTGADSLNVGKTLSVTAADSITFTTGKSSITMNKDGTIVISGKDITVEGSGEIIGKATKNMTLKGKKILQN